MYTFSFLLYLDTEEVQAVYENEKAVLAKDETYTQVMNKTACTCMCINTTLSLTVG